MFCLLQGPLLELAPRLASYVKPQGTILLSGILLNQWPAVREAYEHSFCDFVLQSEGTWAMVLGVRKSDMSS